MADQCRSCEAPILWAVTVNGRPMPISLAEGTPPDKRNVTLEKDLFDEVVARVVEPGRGTHIAHFVDCPNWQSDKDYQYEP